MSTVATGEGSLDDATVMRVVTEVVGRICGIDPGGLTPGQHIADLDIDSLYAAEIVVQIETALDVDIDVRAIIDDWSGLTLHDLVTQLRLRTRS